MNESEQNLKGSVQASSDFVDGGWRDAALFLAKSNASILAQFRSGTMSQRKMARALRDDLQEFREAVGTFLIGGVSSDTGPNGK